MRKSYGIERAIDIIEQDNLENKSVLFYGVDDGRHEVKFAQDNLSTKVTIMINDKLKHKIVFDYGISKKLDNLSIVRSFIDYSSNDNTVQMSKESGYYDYIVINNYNEMLTGDSKVVRYEANENLTHLVHLLTNENNDARLFIIGDMLSSSEAKVTRRLPITFRVPYDTYISYERKGLKRFISGTPTELLKYANRLDKLAMTPIYNSMGVETILELLIISGDVFIGGYARFFDVKTFETYSEEFANKARKFNILNEFGPNKFLIEMTFDEDRYIEAMDNFKSTTEKDKDWMDKI